MKKLLTSLLCVVMVVCFMPAMAWADVADTDVAKIGDTGYATLQAAVDATDEGTETTVTLIKDTEENVTVAQNKNIVLDLNGHTLNGGTTSNKAALTNNGGTVKIVDSGEGGTIKREDSSKAGAYYTILNNSGELTICGGKVENNSGQEPPAWSGASLICNGPSQEAILNIQGGHIEQNKFIAVKNDEHGILNISGGEIKSETQAVQNWSEADITGGTISGEVDTWATTMDAATNRSPSGKTKITGGKITGNVLCIQYESLADNAEMPSVEIADKAEIEGIVAITSSNVDASSAKGQITISGGTVTGQANNFTQGSLDIKGNANIIGNVNNMGAGNIDVSENAKVTGNVESRGTGTLTIAGGTVTGSVTKADNSNLSVTGGTFNTADVSAYIPTSTSGGVEYVKYIKGTDIIVLEKGVAPPSHSAGKNTWSWNDTTGAYEESYVPPYIPPTTQKPIIESADNATVTLSTDGTQATIKVADGYELVDVTVNGVSKGKVDTLTGLKTGDKIVVKTQKKADDNAALIEAVKNTKLVARTEMSKAKGKKAVKVYWYAKDGSELNFDGYEVYRSLKRYEGFGTAPFFKTAKEKYYNTAIKKGTKYYYKVRAYKVIDGEKVYTDWSTKAWRTVK